jgi:hypothetical protein
VAAARRADTTAAKDDGGLTQPEQAMNPVGFPAGFFAGDFSGAAGFISGKLMKSMAFVLGSEIGISIKLSSFQWLKTRKISRETIIPH